MKKGQKASPATRRRMARAQQRRYALVRTSQEVNSHEQAEEARIAFAFGKVLAQLEGLALTNGTAVKSLAAGVGELLLRYSGRQGS